MIKKLTLFLISSALLLPVLWAAVEFDYTDGTGLNLWIEAGLFAWGLIWAGTGWAIDRHKALLIVPVGYLAVIVILPFVDQSPAKPGMRAVHAIQAGMDESQVRAVLDRYFPVNGRFRHPDFGEVKNGELWFPVDRSDPRFNAAFVIVDFKDGKCVSANFSPD